MSEVIHMFTGKSKGILKLFYSKWNMVQCKILAQLLPSWKQKSPLLPTDTPSSLLLTGKIQ